VTHLKISMKNVSPVSGPIIEQKLYLTSGALDTIDNKILLDRLQNYTGIY